MRFFCFRPEIFFLGKFFQENQNCQFKRKFGTKTNLNIENSVVMFTFVFFRPEINLLGKFISKMKICWFKMTFGAYTNWYMQNSMVVFILSVLDRKYPFWTNFVKNTNCQFKLKFGSQTNPNMQDSMVMFTFSISDGNALFRQMWSTKSKLSV